MLEIDSLGDSAAAFGRVRALLRPPAQRDAVWPAVVAAAFAAASALALATMMIASPPIWNAPSTVKAAKPAATSTAPLPAATASAAVDGLRN